MKFDNPFTFPEKSLAQNEFLSQNSISKVKIIKNLPKIHLLSGNLGPYIPGEIISIPIWIGLLIEKEKLGCFVDPFWFDLNWLEKKIQKENKYTTLQLVPFNYLEISKIFLTKKKEKSNLLLTKISLLDELYTIRFTKLWGGIRKLRGKFTAIKFDQIGSIEIEALKDMLQPFFLLYFLI